MQLALVQPLYHARSSPNVCANFHSRTSTLLQFAKLIAGPSRSVGFLHELKVYTLLPHRFVFICTLLWCNHCTVLEVAPNLRKFPFTDLYGIAVRRAFCGPGPVSGLSAPTPGLHFYVLLPHSFLFICTLLLCSHCTVLEVAPKCAQFSIH